MARLVIAFMAMMMCVVLVASPVNGLDNGLALLPPMGWSTWCTENGLIPCYNDFCNETEVMSIADALVSNGMAALGYRYVNLDDCWAGPRAANGSITADTSRFPSGTLIPLANYLHSKGLYLGIYTDVGTQTCRGNRPGSWPYYDQDAATWASWGVDLVKMDWCDHPSNYTAPQLYGMMRDSLNKTGRPMVFSICEWGLSSPWEWGSSTGNLWRVGPDHLPLWWTPKTNQDPGQGQGTANIIQHMAGLSSYSGPGGWNDPDFLMTGEFTEGFGILSEIDYQTEFSFWCLWNAPLVVATDIRKMRFKQVLLNAEAVAVNQDPLAIAGDRTAKFSDGGEVWAKPLSNNRWAVILYNSDVKEWHSPINTTVLWTSSYLPGWPAASSKASVRDLWAHANLGVFTAGYTATLQPHQSNLLIVSPVSRAQEKVMLLQDADDRRF